MKQSVLSEAWVRHLAEFPRLWVGYSGGLDSTVLLHALIHQPALAGRVAAIHVHHGLSPHATSWSLHCAAFCEQQNIAFHLHRVQLEAQSNLEEIARQARWHVFSSHVTSEDALLLAHHQDDQAETVLLQLCRGAGVDGLSGMRAERPGFSGTLIRPLLDIPRAALQQYAAVHQLDWIEDESNQDISFSRNYMRHHVIPLLNQKWPAAAAVISRSAMHCQQAQSNLDDLAYLDCPDLMKKEPKLTIGSWVDLKEARVFNVLRTWLVQQIQRAPSTAILTRVLHDVIHAQDDRTPCVRWGAWQIRRYRQMLYLSTCSSNKPQLTTTHEWCFFPEPLYLNQLNGYLTAVRGNQGISIPEGSCVRVGFRQGGESIVWHGKTRALKTLFQTWGVPPWLRDQIPLIYLDDVLVAVLDFCVRDGYHEPRVGMPVYFIQYHIKKDV